MPRADMQEARKKTSPVVIFVDGAKLLPLQEDPCCEGRGQLLESGVDHTEVWSMLSDALDGNI